MGLSAILSDAINVKGVDKSMIPKVGDHQKSVQMDWFRESDCQAEFGVLTARRDAFCSVAGSIGCIIPVGVNEGISG